MFALWTSIKRRLVPTEVGRSLLGGGLLRTGAGIVGRIDLLGILNVICVGSVLLGGFL